MHHDTQPLRLDLALGEGRGAVGAGRECGPATGPLLSPSIHSHSGIEALCYGCLWFLFCFSLFGCCKSIKIAQFPKTL